MDLITRVNLVQGLLTTKEIPACVGGGVTRILVPDNLKTGVIKNTPTELILNRSYYEMAEHYGTAIIPARPIKPKDKPTAEGTVKVIETWILAALRNRKFFSFEDLNKAIIEKLEEFNVKPFQKRKGSRLTAFIEEEKEFLMPLPASPYEAAVWSTATIQPDYLITVGDCKYSVPHEFIGKKVDIRTTDNSIEVFFHNNRIVGSILNTVQILSLNGQKVLEIPHSLL